MSETTRIPMRRIPIELSPSGVDRLERVKTLTDAATYAEVFRAALRSYERDLLEQQRKLRD